MNKFYRSKLKPIKPKVDRRKTTGRYDTEEELIESVIADYIDRYLNGSSSQAAIAKMNGVSDYHVRTIWKKHRPELKFIDAKDGGPRYERV